MRIFTLIPLPVALQEQELSTTVHYSMKASTLKQLVARCGAIFCLLVPMVVLLGCGIPAEPRPLAEAFVRTMQANDFQGAMAMVDAESRDRIRFVQSIATNLPANEQAIITGFPAGTVDIRAASESGDEAQVTYAIGAGLPETLTLVRTSGGWRVRYQARNLYP